MRDEDFLQRTYRIYQRGFGHEELVPQTQALCVINNYASEQRFRVQFTEAVPLAARGPETTFSDECPLRTQHGTDISRSV